MGVLRKRLPSWTGAPAAMPFPRAQRRHHPVCAQRFLLCSLGDGNVSFENLMDDPGGLLGGAGASLECWPSPC